MSKQTKVVKRKIPIFKILSCKKTKSGLRMRKSNGERLEDDQKIDPTP